MRVAILDPANNMVLPPGRIGEVCINGPNVTSGYLNRPEANKEAFAGGWFHTGACACSVCIVCIGAWHLCTYHMAMDALCMLCMYT